MSKIFSCKYSLLLGLAMLLHAGAALGHDYAAGALKISHPWSRATPKGATVGGGYLNITNTGNAVDRLTAVSVDVAPRAEIHRMSLEQGVMRMRPMPEGIEIKPGETVELKPEGFHLMFIGLKQPLEKGQRVKGTLTFEKAGKVDVEFSVDTAAGGSKMDHSGH